VAYKNAQLIAPLVFPAVRACGHWVTYVQLTQFTGCVALSAVVGGYLLTHPACAADPRMFAWITAVYLSYLLFFVAYFRERKRTTAAQQQQLKGKKQH
jgi:hypothetical protein